MSVSVYKLLYGSLHMNCICILCAPFICILRWISVRSLYLHCASCFCFHLVQRADECYFPHLHPWLLWSISHVLAFFLITHCTAISQKTKTKNQHKTPQLRIGVVQETFEGILWSQDPRPRKQMTQFWTTSARYRQRLGWALWSVFCSCCSIGSTVPKSLLYLNNVNDTILYIIYF